jgi:hypothetical protein
MTTTKGKKRPDFSALTVSPPPVAAANPAPDSAPLEALAHSNIKKRSKSAMLYLHPAGHKALKLYGVEAGRPMHDLLMEAVEDWCKRHGIHAPIRSEAGR